MYWLPGTPDATRWTRENYLCVPCGRIEDRRWLSCTTCKPTGRGGGAGRDRGGRGGGGHGNDHGRKRSNFRWDHVTSKGGAALDKCKLEDGSWNVGSILDGQFDREARHQNHITKIYYPENARK